MPVTEQRTSIVDDTGVLVVGSANHDVVLMIDAMPGPGETVVATRTIEYLGGKGQCQAVAARRFGSPTTLVAAVGSDEWGQIARTELEATGVDTSHLRTGAAATGRATVMLDTTGENSIVVEPGANAELQHLEQGDLEAIDRSGLLLVQLEAGPDVAFEAIRAARNRGIRVVLNAAPVAAVPPEVLAAVDCLIVNEVEVCQLTGEADHEEAARQLATVVGTVMVTLGARGGRLYRAAHETVEEPALPVEVVDTTGAGDSASGVFAAAIAQGYVEADAFRLGLLAGSIATQTLGCVPSVPLRDQVLAAFEGVHGRAPKKGVPASV